MAAPSPSAPARVGGRRGAVNPGAIPAPPPAPKRLGQSLGQRAADADQTGATTTNPDAGATGRASNVRVSGGSDTAGATGAGDIDTGGPNSPMI